jgi:imidazole glycerol-phosphate synthase subunit HisH
MSDIAIIDYQMGNLRSVQKAFEKVGHAARITSKPAELAAADKVVLPGVGAFGDAMAELRRRELVEPIREAIASGKPFLGICLGLQLLFDIGYEGGEFEGLGVFHGKVVRFDLAPPLKVPHMGWNRGTIKASSPMLAGVADGSFFYFVHSYHVVPEDRGLIAIEADYGHPFCAAVARGNLLATQFHPEKSQAEGLKILKNFAELPAFAEIAK